MNVKCTYSLDFFLCHCAQQTYQRSMYQTLTKINIKNHIFRSLHSKCIAIIISICQFDHRIFKLTIVMKRTCVLKGKCIFFVKLHPKSSNDRDTSVCNDTGSLEACIWKTELINLFLLNFFSFSSLSKHDTSYSTNTSLSFSQLFWVVIQWLKTDNMTFFDF